LAAKGNCLAAGDGSSLLSVLLPQDWNLHEALLIHAAASVSVEKNEHAFLPSAKKAEKRGRFKSFLKKSKERRNEMNLPSKWVQISAMSCKEFHALDYLRHLMRALVFGGDSRGRTLRRRRKSVRQIASRALKEGIVSPEDMLQVASNCCETKTFQGLKWSALLTSCLTKHLAKHGHLSQAFRWLEDIAYKMGGEKMKKTLLLSSYAILYAVIKPREKIKKGSPKIRGNEVKNFLRQEEPSEGDLSEIFHHLTATGAWRELVFLMSWLSKNLAPEKVDFAQIQFAKLILCPSRVKTPNDWPFHPVVALRMAVRARHFELASQTLNTFGLDRHATLLEAVRRFQRKEMSEEDADFSIQALSSPRWLTEDPAGPRLRARNEGDGKKGLFRSRQFLARKRSFFSKEEESPDDGQDILLTHLPFWQDLLVENDVESHPLWSSFVEWASQEDGDWIRLSDVVQALREEVPSPPPVNWSSVNQEPVEEANHSSEWQDDAAKGIASSCLEDSCQVDQSVDEEMRSPIPESQTLTPATPPHALITPTTTSMYPDEDEEGTSEDDVRASLRPLSAIPEIATELSSLILSKERKSDDLAMPTRERPVPAPRKTLTRKGEEEVQEHGQERLSEAEDGDSIGNPCLLKMPDRAKGEKEEERVVKKRTLPPLLSPGDLDDLTRRISQENEIPQKAKVCLPPLLNLPPARAKERVYSPNVRFLPLPEEYQAGKYAHMLDESVEKEENFASVQYSIRKALSQTIESRDFSCQTLVEEKAAVEVFERDVQVEENDLEQPLVGRLEQPLVGRVDQPLVEKLETVPSKEMWIDEIRVEKQDVFVQTEEEKEIREVQDVCVGTGREEESGREYAEKEVQVQEEPEEKISSMREPPKSVEKEGNWPLHVENERQQEEVEDSMAGLESLTTEESKGEEEVIITRGESEEEESVEENTMDLILNVEMNLGSSLSAKLKLVEEMRRQLEGELETTAKLAERIGKSAGWKEGNEDRTAFTANAGLGLEVLRRLRAEIKEKEENESLLRVDRYPPLPFSSLESREMPNDQPQVDDEPQLWALLSSAMERSPRREALLKENVRETTISSFPRSHVLEDIAEVKSQENSQ